MAGGAAGAAGAGAGATTGAAGTAAGGATPATRVAEAADAFMDLPPAQRLAFSVWGLLDTDSWLRAPPNDSAGTDQPLLFDDQGRPKPAFEALAGALKRP